jgi:mitochondrial fission protein ELM1
MNAPLLPASTTAWILSDGKIGDETQCYGIAEALGLTAERRLVAPRWAYALLMPYGPIDPRDKPNHPRSPLAPPFPDIAIAAGRRTVAYLQHLKRVSAGRTFTLFIKDPYIGCGAADLIWVPRHDRLRGANVIATPTPAHRMSAAVLEAARHNPDARLAALPAPQLTMILGGPSQHHRYSQATEKELATIARQSADAGYSVMVTGSRRTPRGLLTAVKAALLSAPGQHFVWEGIGANPYAGLLAAASVIFVTGDSVNMMAEAVATGAPVHIYEPPGRHAKITAYIDYLVGSGAARRWTGQLERWSYAPIDATPFIAEAVACRYQGWRASKT